MDLLIIWILALIGLGLFVYFVPYKNIKIVHKKLDTIIQLLNKNIQKMKLRKNKRVKDKKKAAERERLPPRSR